MAYTKNTWVDQAGQVRYTETVDGSYKIFTPNFDNVTEVGTPVNALNMNHIEDGIEDCYTDLVQRKSTSQATGDSDTPVYVKADGVVEVCGKTLENERFDGQWDLTRKLLSTETTVGVKTIDLSTYLPVDNYSYAVKIAFLGYRSGGTTNSFVSIARTNQAITDIYDLFSSYGWACCSFDGEHAENGNFDVEVVVDSSRKIYFGIQNFGIYTGCLVATGYRRIGTNS